MEERNMSFAAKVGLIIACTIIGGGPIGFAVGLILTWIIPKAMEGFKKTTKKRKHKSKK